jgi:hypothetical protein
MWTKNELSEQLRNTCLEVSFIKKDGTGRVMNCTLMEKFLPPMMEDTETATKDNPDVLAVWDIDNGGWRSFRINSIIDVKQMVIND